MTVTESLPIRIYVNKIENRISFKFKTGTYNTYNTKTKEEYGVNVPHLEITSLVLIHCILLTPINNYLSLAFKSLLFICSESFDQLLDISDRKYFYR